MNIPRYELEGWEADDLHRHHLRKVTTAGGLGRVVVTGDKDSLQLITEHTTVKLVSTRMGQTTTKDMTPETFREEYGFDPIHIIDLKALMGDASRQHPRRQGRRGEDRHGPDPAATASMEAIYAKLDQTWTAKPAVIKKLAEGEEDRPGCPTIWPPSAATRPWTSPRRTPVGGSRQRASALYELFLRAGVCQAHRQAGPDRPQAARSRRQEPAALGTCSSEIVTDQARMRGAAGRLRRGRERRGLPGPARPGRRVRGVRRRGEPGPPCSLRGPAGGLQRISAGLFLPETSKRSPTTCKDLMGRAAGRGTVHRRASCFDTALAAYLLWPPPTAATTWKSWA